VRFLNALLQTLFWLRLGAADLPVFGQEYGTLFNLFHKFILFLAVFTPYVYITKIGSVYLEVEMTRIGGLMRLHADKLNVVELSGVLYGGMRNEQETQTGKKKQTNSLHKRIHQW
jgi:hypothetical protein